MGKRELLLVIAFVVVGVVVYQATAPPPPPGSQGFSFGRMIQQMRRGIHGKAASTTIERNQTERVDSSIQELRFVLGSRDLTIVGEDRSDVEINFRVTSNGYDDAEARKLAEATALSVTRAGSSIVFAVNYPREGRQTSRLTIRAPKRLRMRLEPGGGRLDVSNLAAVEVMGMSGEISVKNISGPVMLNHRGGTLTVDGAASLRLTTRGGDIKVQRIAGTLTLQSQGGEIELSDVTGPADIEARNTDLRLDKIKMLKAPLRVDVTSGSLKIDGLRTEARIDGRDTDMEVAFDAAAPVTIYNTSEDISITPPPGGYTIDAVTTDGRISVGDGELKPSGTDAEQHVSGSVRGGGPGLTLRATRGDINVRSR